MDVMNQNIDTRKHIEKYKKKLPDFKSQLGENIIFVLLKERFITLTDDKALKVASLQQISRRITGSGLSLKLQCIRVSLNLTSTPSTLSCKTMPNSE